MEPLYHYLSYTIYLHKCTHIFNHALNKKISDIIVKIRTLSESFFLLNQSLIPNYLGLDMLLVFRRLVAGGGASAEKLDVGENTRVSTSCCAW